jgi:hypothetical protein
MAYPGQIRIARVGKPTALAIHLAVLASEFAGLETVGTGQTSSRLV